MIKSLLTFAKVYRPYTGNAGFYASVVPTDRSTTEIVEWCKHIGYPLTQKEVDSLHCTIIWSPVSVPKPLPEVDASKVYLARLLGIEWWEGHDKEGYLVFRLASKELEARNALYKRYGARSKFEDYVCHMTLKNGCANNLETYLRAKKLLYRYVGSTIELACETFESAKAPK